jgi:hypothetical protein
VSPSEIAFLAVGIVIGTAVGAAIIEAMRARPAPKRQVRVTISPNSVHARRPATLADPVGEGRGAYPGSPGDVAWPDAPTRTAQPAPATATVAPAEAADGGASRTRVPSAPVAMPETTVAVPVVREGASPVGPGVPAPASRNRPSASLAAKGDPVGVGPSAPAAPQPGAVPGAHAAATSVAVLDPVPVGREEGRVAMAVPVHVRNTPLPASIDVGERVEGLVVRPRYRGEEPRASIPAGVVAVAVADLRAQGARAQHDAEDGGGGATAAPEAAVADPCATPRRLVDERCALAGAARDNAKTAADTLREAQRAYDTLRERLDQAQAAADPRGIAAAKDELHRRFRAASDAAGTADDAEAAAREWLNAINELNSRAREAVRFLESGGAELRAAMPRIERLAVEADAARISAEGAEAGCQDARERLAVCEEEAVRAAREASAPPAEEPHPFDALWPGEAESTRSQPMDAEPAASPTDEALILRMLRGDRDARDSLVASLSDGDAEAAPAWQLRLTGLMDAIVARAIEDGYLDVPDDDAFWGLFEHAERRDIVGALSALGYRFDGLQGFADGRVPAARDLSLAVGYAGLDRMRIRVWPREAELATLYGRATVAADEWLVDQADDLALGRMVDALGARAAELADVWNAWGRLRPALLAAS